MFDTVTPLWLKDGHNLWDINDKDYVIEINWSKIPFDDYKKLANNYAQCGYMLFKEIISDSRDNKKSDMWFLSGIFLMRQAIELGLKALICRISDRNPETQRTFQECGHDLSKLFSYYVTKNEFFLLHNEQQWLVDYLASIEEVDEKSDIFRFPFEDNFLIKFRNQSLDIVAIANNMYQVYSIVKKCINCGTYDSDYKFIGTRKPIFLILSSNGFGNCHLWEPISDKGFHTKIIGYRDTAEFLFYECFEINLSDKLYPLIFLQRNAIELSLKRLFYSRVDNGVPEHKFFSKRRSHLLKKDLWNNVQPMLRYYSNENDEGSEDIGIIENMILQIDALDKNGDCFRYPTTYSLEYRYQKSKIDVKNVFEFMRAIINFLEGCDIWLDVISDYESEMHLYYDDYSPYDDYSF